MPVDAANPYRTNSAYGKILMKEKTENAMPYQISWEVENFIVYIKYFDVIEINDLLEVQKDIKVALKEAEKKIHFLVDVTEATDVNFRIYDLISNPKLVKKMRRNRKFGYISLYNHSHPLAVYVAKAAFWIFGDWKNVFDNKEEAFSHIIEFIERAEERRKQREAEKLARQQEKEKARQEAEDSENQEPTEE